MLIWDSNYGSSYFKSNKCLDGFRKSTTWSWGDVFCDGFSFPKGAGVFKKSFFLEVQNILTNCNVDVKPLKASRSPYYVWV